MVKIRTAIYSAIFLHFARKIASRASACNPRVLRRRALYKGGGSVRFLSTSSPKGSYFAERYLYEEKDKAKVGYDIAALYPKSMVYDTSYDSVSKTLKCDFWVSPAAFAREIKMECQVERG
jgi:hypothetical protein